jgi:hypothetical protein
VVSAQRPQRVGVIDQSLPSAGWRVWLHPEGPKRTVSLMYTEPGNYETPVRELFYRSSDETHRQPEIATVRLPFPPDRPVNLRIARNGVIR